MNNICRLLTIMSLLLGVACMGKTQSSSEEVGITEAENVVGVQLSERESLLYTNTLPKVEAAEMALKNFDTAENPTAILDNVRKLQYPYNAKNMNAETREYCEALQYRIDTLKEYAKRLSSDTAVEGGVRSGGAVKKGKPHIVEGMEREPYYLAEGDVMHFEVSAEKNATVNIYNADSYTRLASRNGSEIKDSVKVNFAAIYVVEVITSERQYVATNIRVTNDNSRSLHRPRITTERVQCNKGDFGAMPVEAIKMINIFDEARQFTLRSQIKSAFSGTSRVLVPISVPDGATDILYSMRISTSEQTVNTDGEFCDNLNYSYRKINVLKLPLYESKKSRRLSGIIDMILDDNRPIRDEDAYCNMYVVRNQSDAKKYQDGTISAANMNYDVDYSTLGTQSCNGSIPVNGSKTIYLAYENERMRYANYLWVEAVAVTPITEYYRDVYSIK